MVIAHDLPNLDSAVVVAADSSDSTQGHSHNENVALSASGKRLFDIVVGVLALVVLLPFIASMILIMLALQGRPVLIKHRRVGRGGILFPCFKFRTMVVNADDVLQEHLARDSDARLEWSATRKLKNDPRITPIGRVLRKSSVDELPQLLNVLRGDMSLVGPRPIVEPEVQHYGAFIHQYLKVRPGLTGSWQVSGRSNASYEQRVQLDSDYVRNWSFGRDLVILIKTVPAVLTSRGSY